MRILRDRSCLLVIDFQERIFPFIAENEKLLKNVPVLINGLKALHLPVFVTEQYTKDYSGKKYLMKNVFTIDPSILSSNPALANSVKLKDYGRLKISSIVGRQNFKCKYLEENPINTEVKREKNAKIFDIYEAVKKPLLNKNNTSCDNLYLPCKIELKEKNIDMILETEHDKISEDFW